MRWSAYTGATQDEPPYWAAAVHPEDRERCVAAWGNSVETGEPFQAEARLRRSDGSYRWHIMRAYPQRAPGGHVLRWFGTGTDIDDQKRDKEIAEAAARVKDEFLATLSHELRTPLNAILGWATLLRRGLDAAKQDRAIDVIERNARAQARLVDDLLDVSRIVSGKLRLSMNRVDMSVVIQAAVDVARPAADAKCLELHVDLAPEVGAVAGDPGRLQQVVWNLLSNAVKFTPSRGRITVVAKRVDSTLVVEVSDTGVGIPRDHLPYVFERFRQVDSSSTRAHGGLGLGLAIVRHLVEAHGGSVSAHSDGPGLGARFTVKLPIRAVVVAPRGAEEAAPDGRGVDEVQAVSPAPDAAACALKGVRALVVEDDPDSLDLLRTVLQRAGASVTATPSAWEALEASAHAAFDVVVSDIGMPEMNGYAFIKLLRAQSPSPIPAIALTAYANDSEADQARRAGYERHIAKPADYRQVVDSVRDVVASANA